MTVNDFGNTKTKTIQRSLDSNYTETSVYFFNNIDIYSAWKEVIFKFLKNKHMYLTNSCIII